MKRVGIYQYQYSVGGCKLCSQYYSRCVITDCNKCHEYANRLFGEECVFLHYVDLGAFKEDDVDRPNYKRMISAVENEEIDVLLCYKLMSITTDISALIDLYKKTKAHGIAFITMELGEHTAEVMDAFVQKNQL